MILYYTFENFIYHLFLLRGTFRETISKHFAAVPSTCKRSVSSNISAYTQTRFINQHDNPTLVCRHNLSSSLEKYHCYHLYPISTAAGLLSFEIHVMSETRFFNCFQIILYEITCHNDATRTLYFVISIVAILMTERIKLNTIITKSDNFIPISQSFNHIMCQNLTNRIFELI